MKRKIAALALIALAAICGPALAGTTADITITVTVEYLSIAASPTTVDLGTVAAGTTTVSSKVDITNDGNVAENIGLAITVVDSTGGWTVGSSAGANQYSLRGIIVNDGGAAPVVGDVGADDMLGGGVLYWGGDGTAAGSRTTANVAVATPVPAAGARDLYFGFLAPTSVSGGTAGLQHSITVQLSVYKD
ncbi:MAG: hypothetical protein FJ291_14145 [Planctomycetes bacterium]|nr:hypothetical protein [Planctomycetota bacterium]